VELRGRDETFQNPHHVSCRSGFRKHPSIGANDGFHPALFDQSDDVTVRKTVKTWLEESGLTLCERTTDFFHWAVVSNIAPPTAGNEDLDPDAAVSFEEENPGAERRGTPGGNNAGASGSNNDERGICH
jgi:hypothetical protein